MKKALVPGGVLVAQWLGLGVIAYTVGRPNIDWRLIFYELLVAVLLVAVVAGVARWLFRVRRGYWFVIAQVCTVVLIHPFISMARPHASTNDTVALLIGAILVGFAPLVLAAYNEQQRENRTT